MTSEGKEWKPDWMKDPEDRLFEALENFGKTLSEFFEALDEGPEAVEKFQRDHFHDCDRYIIEGERVVKATTFEQWRSGCRFKQLLRTDIAPGTFTSTVFLGIDHQSNPEGPRLLFETMSFLDWDYSGLDQVRTSTVEAALTAHRELHEFLEIAHANKELNDAEHD